MIYPQKNKFITWFFHNYMLRIIKSNFKAVEFNHNIKVDSNRSVLLLANHFSWWDGFLMYYVNHKLFGKNFYVMVIEETVKKIPFFKYMGAFSVNKHSRDVLASLHYAAGLLNQPGNLVLIFPQGRLHSNFVDGVEFEKGLSKIMQAAAGNYQIIMAATFIENLQYKKPTASVYLKAAGAVNDINHVQSAYLQHYHNAKQQQTKIVI